MCWKWRDFVYWAIQCFRQIHSIPRLWRARFHQIGLKCLTSPGCWFHMHKLLPPRVNASAVCGHIQAAWITVFPSRLPEINCGSRHLIWKSFYYLYPVTASQLTEMRAVISAPCVVIFHYFNENYSKISDIHPNVCLQRKVFCSCVAAPWTFPYLLSQWFRWLLGPLGFFIRPQPFPL